MNKEIKINWKQTTSNKLKCNLCKEKLNNSMGCIEINSTDSYYSNHRVLICWNCFQNLLKEIETKRGTEKQREKNYSILIKKRMLRELR